MAWALMESKIHDARSRKVARALLHRAVALNPRRHAAVLSWRVFVDWKEAGEAAVEAVRSVVSNIGQSSTAAPVPATATITTTKVSHFRDQNSPLYEKVARSVLCCMLEMRVGFRHYGRSNNVFGR